MPAEKPTALALIDELLVHLASITRDLESKRAVVATIEGRIAEEIASVEALVSVNNQIELQFRKLNAKKRAA
jgi:hypothetical protein